MIALSGIMERRGEEEAMRAKAESSMMLMLFSWTEAALRKKSSPQILCNKSCVVVLQKPQKLLCQDGRFV